MSSIYVMTLIEALDKPSTLKALSRKTGYPMTRLLTTLVQARADGYIIKAVSRKGEATYYERLK